MSLLRDHLESFSKIATTPETRPGFEPTPVPEPAPAAAPPPAAPAAPVATPSTTPTTDPVSPALRTWLQQQVSGHNVLTPEMYNYFGGDELLKQLQQFDPAAHWSLVDISGGEGGGSGQGLRLDYDPAKLPAVGGPGGGRSIFDAGLVPVYTDSKLHNPELVYEDPYYGTLTIAKNVVKPREDWWVTAAPLVVAGLATAGAAVPALAAAEAGAGAAAAIGSEAASLATSSPWWAQALSKVPEVAKQITPPTATPYVPPAQAPAGNNALGIPTEYNAANYNNTGSAKKPGSNESALVATDFADDPYRFSR